MTRDDLHQVIYKCETCATVKALDDISLLRISEEFKRLGWTNTPKPIGDKIEYIVHCPNCIERQVRAEDMYHDACIAEDDDEYREWEAVQDSQDMERQGLWH